MRSEFMYKGVTSEFLTTHVSDYIGKKRIICQGLYGCTRTLKLTDRSLAEG